MKQYDAIFIGWGKGAKTLVTKLANQGQHIAMIEQNPHMYGGACPNVACVPTKSLILHAKNTPYEAAIEIKNKLTNTLNQNNYRKLNSLASVDVYTAVGSFVNDHEVRVKNDLMDEVIYGTNIFIDTGAKAVIPEIKGIHETKHVYTSTELMELTTLPKRLAILGGGYIGLEFASMYAQYGSEVVVFEHGDRLVKREDQDVSIMIQSVLEKQGVSIVFEASITEVKNEDDSVIITYQSGSELKEITVDALLIATGRSANTEHLQLENAHVEVDQRGSILVDEHLCTTNPHVYALGDVKGGLQFTYISLDDSRIVYDHLYGQGTYTTNTRGVIPYSLFISPTFSRVGLSEQEAIAKGYHIKTASIEVSSIVRAKINGHTDGMLKAIVNEENNEILGCVLFCDASEEMINLMTLAINEHIPADRFKSMIFTHPTMSEALNDLFAAF